ncbi:MAG: NADAR family protein [Anaerolineaceae bacterium]|nr:NADAR family protein [Anaerolineaceae bacterium]
MAALIYYCHQGFQPEFLFFWGHQAHRTGEIGKECLSQWWPASFSIDGTFYLTAEHFMMAEKARLFGDFEIHEKILITESPEKVKKLGRLVHGFDEKIWNENRLEIVLRGNRAKFQQNGNLGAYLIHTQEQIIVEASPFDTVWGIGLSEDDHRAFKPEQWMGLNLLGFALMRVRSELNEYRAQ